jgi:hypothetical protein
MEELRSGPISVLVSLNASAADSHPICTQVKATIYLPKKVRNDSNSAILVVAKLKTKFGKVRQKKMQTMQIWCTCARMEVNCRQCAQTLVKECGVVFAFLCGTNNSHTCFGFVAYMVVIALFKGWEYQEEPIQKGASPQHLYIFVRAKAYYVLAPHFSNLVRKNSILSVVQISMCL